MAISTIGTNGLTNPLTSPSSGNITASWTTAGRPASPSDGQFGLNTTLSQMEWYSASSSSWVSFSEGVQYAVQFLVIAGGGGGGTDNGGGGGAGGY